MISVLLVDDHPKVVRALGRALSDLGNVQVLAVADSAEKALELLPEKKVDLVLVDVSLPTISGIDLVAEIHGRYPDLPCLMLSGHLAPQYVQRSLAAGARGYVLKDDLTAILDAIRRILAGEVYVSEELRGGGGGEGTIGDSGEEGSSDHAPI